MAETIRQFSLNMKRYLSGTLISVRRGIGAASFCNETNTLLIGTDVLPSLHICRV